MGLLVGECYAASHGLWPVAAVSGVIVAVSLAALAGNRSVARAIVENAIGPWRTDRFDADRKAEWRDSIEAWISIARVLIVVVSVGAIAIAVIALASQVGCA